MMNKKCKKCKYSEKHKTLFEGFGETLKMTSSLCIHAASVYWCPIAERPTVKSTMLMRNEGEPCGPDAILWEKKE